MFSLNNVYVSRETFQSIICQKWQFIHLTGEQNFLDQYRKLLRNRSRSLRPPCERHPIAAAHRNVERKNRTKDGEIYIYIYRNLGSC